VIRHGAARLFQVFELRDFARVDGWLLPPSSKLFNVTTGQQGNEVQRIGELGEARVVFSDINLVSWLLPHVQVLIFVKKSFTFFVSFCLLYMDSLWESCFFVFLWGLNSFVCLFCIFFLGEYFTFNLWEVLQMSGMEQTSFLFQQAALVHFLLPSHLMSPQWPHHFCLNILHFPWREGWF
jgi:hypothetical protein